MAIRGFRRQSLSASGAAAAVLVGTSTYMAGTWRWSCILFTFFTSSSALSKREDHGAESNTVAGLTERGSRRDLVQALANGGIATAAACLHNFRPHPRLATAFAGAYAAANADTWATEIGGMSPTPPRRITNGSIVPAGMSGGVTLLGLAGASAGGALIGLVAATTLEPQASLRLGVVVWLAGMTGALIDSLAGATLQAAYVCPICKQPTERRIHSCGTATTLVSGYSWCTNDLVNVFCTASGALVAAIASSSKE